MRRRRAEEDLRLGVPAKFKIDSTEAGNGDLECRILDAKGNEVDIDHDQNDYGEVLLTFRAVTIP